MPGNVLVVDPMPTNRILLKCRIAAGFHRVVLAADAREAALRAGSGAVDLAVIGAGFDLLAAGELLLALKSVPGCATLPVLVLTPTSERTALRAALAAGAEDALPPGLQEEFLMSRIRRLLQRRNAMADLADRNLNDLHPGMAEPRDPYDMPGRVMLVTGSAITGDAWKRAMAGSCRHHVEVATRAEALGADRHQPAPDIIVVQHAGSETDPGLRLLSELRCSGIGRNARTVLICDGKGPPDRQAETRLAMALDFGADEVMRNGFDVDELAMRLELQLARKRSEDMLLRRVRDRLRDAMRDPLTGLHNRRHAVPQLQRMLTGPRGQTGGVAVMMADLDRFKQVNDGYGHAAGDAVLVEIARRLQDALRRQDLLARIGGEEFLIAVPDTDVEQAQALAARLCARVSEAAVAIRPGLSIPVTISIGLALIRSADFRSGDAGGPPDAERAAQRLMARADHALYRAKCDGRNRITVSLSAA